MDDSYSRPRGSALPIVAALLLGLVTGALLLAGLIGRWPALDRMLRLHQTAVVVERPVPVPVTALVRQTGPAPDADLLARLDGLEQRVARIDQSARAASGDADRAEGLLVAFAARRALDRGRPLGYLEGLLRERFGGVDPQSVAIVIGAAQQPVTLPDLQAGLNRIGPEAVAAPRDGWWQGLRRELASLVVVRPAAQPSPMPADRLARATQALEVGHVDRALAEVARMPGQAQAQGWIAAARRYVLARNALDRIETDALLAQPAASRVRPAS